jgi:AcrR family transcriptional regulator
MKKGDLRRQAILEAGLKMASSVGLEAVTIGGLAKATGMSKSGLFAHFQSKENLQMEILAFAGQVFADHVVVPALAAPAGVVRIKTLVDNWVAWTERLSGGCIFVAASTEFSDRPGPVRDFLLRLQADWLDSLTRMARSAIRVGDFRADIDPGQFAFDLYSLLLGFHLYDKLLEDAKTRQRQQAALERLLATYRQPAGGVSTPSASP